MKIRTVSIAAAALIAMGAALPASAERDRGHYGERGHGYGHYRQQPNRVVVVERPVYVERQVYVDRPVYVERTRVVERPVYVERPVVVERQVYVEREPAYSQPYPAAPVNYGGGSPWGQVGGAIAGAALGTQIGNGNGRIAATAIGAVLGAVVGGNLSR